MKLRAITNDTLQIVEAGGYEHEGRRIEIGGAVARACAGARAHAPAETAEVVARVAAVEGTSRGEVTVTPESTAACARRLVGEGARVACLNFASAKNPGGGFLGSARAQEEQLCRASGLYPTLLTQRVYYDANRANRDARYTDWAITSPELVARAFVDVLSSSEAGELDGAVGAEGRVDRGSDVTRVRGACAERQGEGDEAPHRVKAGLIHVAGCWGDGGRFLIGPEMRSRAACWRYSASAAASRAAYGHVDLAAFFRERTAVTALTLGS